MAQYFKKGGINWIVCLLVPICIGFISWIGIGIVFNFKKKKIIRVLSEPPDEELVITEVWKREHFEALKFSSVNDALSYINVGLIYHCDWLVDFSFLRYMAENYADPQVIYAVSRVGAVFPGQLQFFGYVLGLISKYTNKNIGRHFLHFQMKRIHFIRQSSISEDSSQRLISLQKLSNETISQFRGFWTEVLNSNHPISFTSMKFLHKISVKTNTSFLDAIETYPNNISMMQEFIRFKLEVLGDYAGAIKLGKKLYQLEQGRTLLHDHALQNFLQSYPNYLYDGILDTKGNPYGRGSKISRSQSTSFSTASSNSTEGEQLDERNDEFIHSYFEHGKLKLAMQAKLRTFRLNSTKLTYIFGFFQLLIISIFYGILLIVLPQGPEESKKIYKASYEFSELTITYQYLLMATTMIGMKQFEHDIFLAMDFHLYEILQDTVVSELDLNEDDIPNVPSLYNDTYQLLYEQLKIFKDDYLKLIIDLDDPYLNTVDEYFSDPIVNFSRMFKGFGYQVREENPKSIRQYVIYYLDKLETLQLVHQRHIKAQTPFPHIDLDNMFTPHVIEIVLNSIQLSPILVGIQEFLLQEGKSHTVQMNKKLNSLMIGLSASFFSVFMLVRIANLIYILKNMKQVSNAIRHFPTDKIKESFKPVCLKTVDNKMWNQTVHRSNDAETHFYFCSFTVTLSIIISTALFAVSVLMFLNKMKTDDLIYQWLAYNSNSYAAACSGFGAIVSFMSGQVDIYIPNATIDALRVFKNITNNSYDGLVKAIAGNDKYMSDLFLEQHGTFTEENIDNFTWATKVAMMSYKERFDIMLSYLNLVTLDYQKPPGMPKEQVLYVNHLFFLFNQYIVADFEVIENSILDYATRFYTSTENMLLILAIVGIALALLTYLIEISWAIAFQKALEGFVQLILVLPPIAVMQNQEMISLILGDSSKNSHSIIQSWTQIFIDETSCPLIQVDSNLIIQKTNKALQVLTGFVPDQVLGQNLSMIIPHPKQVNNENTAIILDHFYKMIEQFKLNAKTNETTIKVKISTENGNLIVTKANIVADRDENDKLLSIAFLLRDQTSQILQKKAIKKSKARADLLIEGLLPPEVVVLFKEKRGKTFRKSECATIICIEFADIALYAHTFTPKEMMSLLDTFYKEFERIATNFPAIKPLYRNGETYICCSGLFDFQDSPDQQAEQSVLYCQELINIMYKLNTNNEVNIHLRIGINMGGDVVGDLLSYNSPIFYVFTNLMHLATKMQSEGPVDKVQITETVKNNLPEKFNYNVGPVKDGPKKNPTLTYIVRF